jgi:hypothetical protein
MIRFDGFLRVLEKNFLKMGCGRKLELLLRWQVAAKWEIGEEGGGGAGKKRKR